METKGSLPCSQESATGSSTALEFSAHTHTLFISDVRMRWEGNYVMTRTNVISGHEKDICGEMITDAKLEGTCVEFMWWKEVHENWISE
jgi:hypothetical protein